MKKYNKIGDELTLTIDGKEYLFTEQFGKLIGKRQASLRQLINIGNRAGRLKSLLMYRRHLIPVSELFDFDFNLPGVPHRTKKFFLKDGKLKSKIIEE